MIDRTKLTDEIEKLLVECRGKQERAALGSEKWHRAGGQISVLNNLKHKIEHGRFDLTRE